MKKYQIILTTLVMLIAAVTFTDVVSAYAGEGKDTYQDAAVISSANPVTEILTDRKDTDWYQFEVEQDGPFYFQISNTTGSDEKWSLKVHDSDVYEIDYAYNGTVFVRTVNFTGEVGDIFYVQVKRYDSYSTVPETYYKLEVINEALEDIEMDGIWEIENNDTQKKAQKITSKDAVYGLLIDKDDTDVYEYVLPDDGEYSFTFEKTSINKEGWVVCLRNTEFNKVESIELRDIDQTGTTKTYKGSKGDVIYVCVSTRYGSGLKTIYKLGVNETLDKNVKEVDEPYSAMANTNVIVGKAKANATVYVTYSKKTYSAKADANGIFKIKTAKLKSNANYKIWQKTDIASSEKKTYKVTK